ncbi:MAG: hypothetical protein OEY38_12910 [Gammaproteobacteria bacterium]|nr:hypothetical protein [Gammaproteobacteria bacterium]
MTIKICLVGPGHVASNPRLVKEADALQQAGYDVRVVAPIDMSDQVSKLDFSILQNTKWKFQGFSKGGKIYYKCLGVIAKMCLWLTSVGIRIQLVDTLALYRLHFRVLKELLKEPADIYLTHHLFVLPAALQAARKYNAILGYDAEDYLPGELPDRIEYQGLSSLYDRLLGYYIRTCNYVSAASPLISQQLFKRYGVKSTVILNVFPLDHAKYEPKQNLNVHGPSMYWFSQTVGEGRGIEKMIVIMQYMKTPAHLYLRGHVDVEYKNGLLELAGNQLNKRIHFLPSAEPNCMVSLARPYTLGLSIDESQPLNRDICITNKIFTYLLAGIPVLLSSTQANTELAHRLKDAALLFDMEQPQATAQALDEFFTDASRIGSAKKTSLELALKRYNWEHEKHIMLINIKNVLEKNIVFEENNQKISYKSL